MKNQIEAMQKLLREQNVKESVHDSIEDFKPADQKKIRELEKIFDTTPRWMSVQYKSVTFSAYNHTVDWKGSDLKKLGSICKTFVFDQDYDDQWITITF